jgi:hypothetical protein
MIIILSLFRAKIKFTKAVTKKAKMKIKAMSCAEPLERKEKSIFTVFSLKHILKHGMRMVDGAL